MKIKRLEPDVQSLVRSGQSISDATKCVLELVHNSIDAESKSIAVRVNLINFFIQVVDNGVGIEKNDMAVVGERYMTNKCHKLGDLDNHINTFGYKGEALASIKLCCRKLIIQSKTTSGRQTFEKVFIEGEVGSIGASEKERPGTGTTVTVEGFLHNLPVRRKRTKEVFDMEDIKTQLGFLALVHHKISFSLRNDHTGVVLLQTHKKQNYGLSFADVFGLALSRFLVRLQYETNDINVGGFYSEENHTDQDLQFVFVNRRIVYCSKVHKLVNAMLNRQAKAKSQALPNEGCNVFLILIECLYTDFVLLTDTKKTKVEFKNWDVVLKAVYKAIKETLPNWSSQQSRHSLNAQQEARFTEKRIGNPDFGTSQLVSAVHGGAAKRQIVLQKNPTRDSSRHLDSVDEKQPKRQSTHVDHFESIEISKTKNVFTRGANQTISSVVVSRVVSSSRNQVKNDTAEGLPETPFPKAGALQVVSTPHRNPKRKGLRMNLDAPVYLFKDVPQISFHEFQAWLQVKAYTDKTARRLLKEFIHFRKKSESFKVLSPPRERQQALCVGGRQLRHAEHTFYEDDGNGKDSWLIRTWKNSENCRGNENEKKSNHMIGVTKRKHCFEQERQGKLQDDFSNNKKQKHNTKASYVDPLVFKKPEQAAEHFNNKYARKYYDVDEIPTYKAFIDGVSGLSSTPVDSEIALHNVLTLRNKAQSESSKDNVPTPVISTWGSHYRNTGNRQRDFTKEDYRTPLNKTKTPTLLEDNKYKTVGNQTEDVSVADKSVQVTLERIPVEDDSSSEFEFMSLRFNSAASCTTSNVVPETPTEQTPQKTATLTKLDNYENFEKSSVHMQFLHELQVANNLCKSLSPNDQNMQSPVVGIEKMLHESEQSSEQEVLGISLLEKAIPENQKCDVQDTILTSSYRGRTEVDKIQCTEEMEIADTVPAAATQADFLHPLQDYHVKDTEEVIKMTEDFPRYSAFDFFKPTIHSTMNEFSMSARYSFVPKGFSPSLAVSEPLALPSLSPQAKALVQNTIQGNSPLDEVKWQDPVTGAVAKPTLPDTLLSDVYLKAQEKLFLHEPAVISASVSKGSIKVHNLLHSFSFSKDLFSNMKVIGQLDRKFIVVVASLTSGLPPHLLVLFDQHAVDERIRLEKLMKEYHPDGEGFVSKEVTPQLDIELSSTTLDVIKSFQTTVEEYGVVISSVTERGVSVSHVPACLLKKVTEGGSILQGNVQSLLKEIAEGLKNTRGVSFLPKVLKEAINLEACRGAIKFNQTLTVDAMMVLLMELKNCKLPFQCAHGRPSLVPIIDLQHVTTSEKVSCDVQPNLKKF